MAGYGHVCFTEFLSSALAPHLPILRVYLPDKRGLGTYPGRLSGGSQGMVYLQNGDNSLEDTLSNINPNSSVTLFPKVLVEAPNLSAVLKDVLGEDQL